MFHSARIKLTLWYFLISMLISIFFSAVIYKVLTSEVQRFDRLQRGRIERRLQELNQPTFNIMYQVAPPAYDPELINDIELRILWSLVLINTAILLAAGVFGYLLAGRALQPIKTMVDEQNRFISDSSHELRTPLTSLKTALEVTLRDPRLSLAEARQVMTDSVGEVNKLQSLTDGLLQLAQYQKPTTVTNFTFVSLADITKAAINQVASLAKSHHITITNQTKGTKLWADRQGIQDVIVILLDNAIKYSASQTTITLTSQVKDGSVKLLVKDQGIGISPKDLPHIFDRFYRSDEARSKSNGGGYGLGLSIAQKIVTAHHGSLTANSQLQRGTTFTLTLPLKPSA